MTDRPGRGSERPLAAALSLTAASLALGGGAALLFILADTASPAVQFLAWFAAISSAGGFGLGGWFFGRAGGGAAPAGLMRAAVESSPDACLITGPAGDILYANPAFEEIFTGAGARPGRVFDAAAAGIEDEIARVAFSRLGANAGAGRADSAELRLTGLGGPGGPERWYSVSTRPLPETSGLAFWTWRDIGAERRLRAGREKNEALLADLLDFMPVGYFSADSGGRLTYVNDTLAGWLGLSPLDVAADDHYFADFVIAGDSGAGAADASDDGSGLHGRVTLKGTGGEPMRVFLVQSQRDGEDGDFAYSRSVVLPEPFIPGENMDDAAYLERLPWLFSDAPVGLVLLDLQGNVTECNRAFLKLLGLHRDGVVGRPLSDRINKEDMSDATAQLSKVVMGTSPAAVLECRMPALGERELVVSLFASPIEDDEGEVVGLVIHITDTTEHKNLEVQFAQSQKMQAVGQLAGGIAHDFNNLLTAMIGFCDLLLARHGEDDPSFADIMQVKQNANRAANLVRQLLAFSRRQTLQPKVLDITEALANLSTLLRRLIGENIELTFIHGDDAGMIKADPGQFDQVIINLVVNGRDAMPGGGVITISSARVEIETSIQRGHEVMPAGGYMLIKVADTGAGISKENIGHIFEPFFSTKEVGEGTGLGLSTVYGIVRQTGGYVFVDSAPGEGSTFSIYIPAHAGDGAEARVEADQRRAEAVAEEDLTGAGTVLLVEDEDAVRVFGSRALRNKGYRVLEANDGEDALDVINTENLKIDLIITDVVMPGMDGHTLVQLVRQEIPGIKVILMSGYAEETIPGEIAKQPAVHFLPKPFSLQDLAGKVKEVMEG